MKRKTFFYALLFVLCFFAIVLYWLVEYLLRFFGTSDLETVFFHLKFPMLNAGSTVILNFLNTVLLPSVLFTTAIFVAPRIFKMLLRLPLQNKLFQRFLFFLFAAMLCALWQAWFYLSLPVFVVIALFSFFWVDIAAVLQQRKIATRAAFIAHLVVIFGVIGFCGHYVSNKFNLLEFIKAQYDFSDFYEKNYVKFDDSALKDFTPKQNLVVILAESLTPAIHWALNISAEKKEVAGRLEDPALPNLHKILRQNWFFEAENAKGGGYAGYGGLITLINTWTVAGYVSHLCGVPLRMPIERTVAPRGPFMQNAVCVPDIFKKAGYAQIAVSGTDWRFAGQANLLQTHGVSVHDLTYFQAQKMVPPTLRSEFIGISLFGGNSFGVVLPEDVQGAGNWGINDKTLFKLAKQEFLDATQKQQPFVMYVATMDTHGEPFEKENLSCPDLPNSRIGTYQCADRLIADFVDFVSQNSKNTSIVILGDHSPIVVMNEDLRSLAINTLTTQERNEIRDGKTDQYFAPVYNAFIHPLFAQTAEKSLTHNRQLTHFDVAPLLLESVGIRSDAFALGRNPLRGKTLLETSYPYEEFQKEIKRRNRFYDAFW